MPQKKKILIVDDEPLNQIILQEIFNQDYDLSCVDSGNTCMQEVEKNQPALILLDVNMPTMSGLEVCKQLKANEKYAAIPIIFVSSLASEKEKQQGLDAGANGYITKPFSEKDILKKVSLFLA